MFTVVIAGKEHINAIKDYEIFLNPLMQSSNVQFCEWRPDEDTLTDAVPMLRDTVGNCEEWRAVILCDERGLNEKNPFDLIKPKLPEFPVMKVPENGDAGMTPEEQDAYWEQLEDKHEKEVEEYFETLKKVKFEAFEMAAHDPLTRLSTYLCYDKGTIHGRKAEENDDRAYAEYIVESTRKEELRRQILEADVDLNINAPIEVICVAKRVRKESEYDINASWIPHEEGEYSRFTDWNMYFDRMRYLIFDILPKTHRNYGHDYLKFLYTVLILAENSVPRSALQPDRVYRIDCEDNKKALDRIMSLYEAKLAVTEKNLEAKLLELRNKPRPEMNDKEAERIFCSPVNIPVASAAVMSREGLYSEPGELGMAEDCPRSEFVVWTQTFRTSKQTLTDVLKQSKRAVKKATNGMKQLNTPDLEKAKMLTQFQVEDIQEYAGKEEVSMVGTETRRIEDKAEFHERMEAMDAEILKVIDTRMSKKTTIIVGIVGIVIYLLGFVPLLLNNYSTKKTLITTGVLFGSVILLMFLVAMIRLIIARAHLRNLFRDYNAVMKDIEAQIDHNERMYSKYLGHACNLMKSFTVLDFRSRFQDPESLKMMILKKHIEDIKRDRAQLFDIFGAFISGKCVFDQDEIDPYEYNYTRAVDYVYPLPFKENELTKIEYMQPGNEIFIPIDFLDRIVIRREELYE